MTKFRLNKHKLNLNNNNEIHKENCLYYPLLTDFVELGGFIFCSTALQKARDMGFLNVDGCKECCPECHRG